MADAPFISDRFDPRAASDEAEIARALEEGLTGNSEAVERYEAALREAFGAPEAVALSSGSAAVMVAVAALGLSRGDEAIVSPAVPLCTVYPLMGLGITPVFCDTTPDGFGLDREDLRSLVTDKTAAILEVPMWGYPVDAASTAAFAKEAGLPLVMDLAHGHGLEQDGTPLWRFGAAATFSTHASKIMVTGEGGFLLTADEQLAEEARLYSRYGNLAGKHFGMNYKMSGLQAALGAARLPRLFADMQARRAAMADISRRITNPLIEPLPILPGAKENGLTLIVREKAGNGGALVAHMEAQGVPSDVARYGCRPLYRFPILSERARPCPNAEALLGSMTTIPVHPDVSDAERNRIVEVLNAYEESRP